MEKKKPERGVYMGVCPRVNADCDKRVYLIDRYDITSALGVRTKGMNLVSHWKMVF